MRFVREIIRDVMGIENGIGPLEKRYLDYMRVTTRSSLQNLCYALHVDKATIQREIEPILLVKNLIRISSKGRELIV